MAAIIIMIIRPWKIVRFWANEMQLLLFSRSARYNLIGNAMNTCTLDYKEKRIYERNSIILGLFTHLILLPHALLTLLLCWN